jgi:hypothetical protein
VDEPSRLRELTSWYRDFAKRTGNPAIWDARLRTAEDLEAQADLILASQGERVMTEEREQLIRDRAYTIWEDEGRPEGRQLMHWLQAESEIETEPVLHFLDNGKRVEILRLRTRVKRATAA